MTRLGKILMLATAAICFAPIAGLAASPIQGVWMVKDGYQLGAKLSPAPDVTQAVKDQQAKHKKAEDIGYVRTVANILCLPTGGPLLMQMRSPFVVLEGLGRVTFIFETEGSNQPRTVYLNEKTHPDALYPSFNGHSIGHFEGQTLVVDTVGFNGRGALPGGVPKSTETHLIERFTVSADGKTLTDAMTATDPVNLAKPWTTTLVFNRMADSEERFEVWCEPDLDAYRTVDLQAVKDFDPEVALMLDPATRAADPALAIKPGQ